MEAKHTEGPWEFDSGIIPPDGPERYADIYTEGGETIIASFNDQIPEGQANARLIAAAPELLEALNAAEEALTMFTTFEDDARYIMGNTNFSILLMRKEQVRAVIAKATGESQ